MVAHDSASTILTKEVEYAINTYRLQSAFHFAQQITLENARNGPYGSLTVQIGTWNTKIVRTCRVHKHTGDVQALEKGEWKSLETSLKKYFPVSDNETSADSDTMRAWWTENGQTFNWSALPTELKENVLQFCVNQPYQHSITYYDRKKYSRQSKYQRGPHEIFHLLGQWSSLLRVSKQVRILVLRLCLKGSIEYPEGFRIGSGSHKDFARKIMRLGSYYQLVEPNSAPVKATSSQILAKRYLYSPQYYPGLARYATYAHAIRKIDIEFDYLEALHFFKASIGGLEHHRPSNYMTCDVFERLPYLNGVTIWLTRKWWTKGSYILFNIWHDTDPCTRTLERWIYERVAQALNWLSDVTIKNFMDENEERMFRDLHEAHQLSYKMTKAEHDDLYKDEGGGISLEEVVFDDLMMDRANLLSASDNARYCRAKDQGTPPEALNQDGTPVLPPKCRCAVPCREAFFDKPRSSRYQ
ncbi:hypothetical protein EJ04DRAFT_511990 [Polyplosphaeria fusca]|uniref:Uncharacterized protein n=1 Tax=Polyplosphaeria fusca TaxID=682080 RepID=A0A9P4R1S8_9PLEO|nr:hypothetical protein EJ04DRAFT_511990 [Polyplosphaeria fusca]